MLKNSNPGWKALYPQIEEWWSQLARGPAQIERRKLLKPFLDAYRASLQAEKL